MTQMKVISLVLNVTAFIFLAGCVMVSTTARVGDSAGSIAYHLRDGQGPTIVFQSGLGDGKAVWADVIAKMGRTASLFAYDRPGYGGSPASPEPRDPCTIALELRALLRAADVKPPYLLVGHSMGGTYQFHFARLFPEDVAGLVLLDPTHPHHWSRMQQEVPAQARLLKGLKFVGFTGVMRREFDDQEGCNADMDLSIPLDQPTALLFSGRFRLEELGSFERMVRSLRREWMVLFANATTSEVEESGHYLQREVPQAVVDAILKIAEASRASTNLDTR